jgi:hypothetical protein
MTGAALVFITLRAARTRSTPSPTPRPGTPRTLSLGGVWLKSRYDYRRDENQAVRAEMAAQADRRLDAYANLLVAAGNVLGTYQRLPGLLPPAFDDQALTKQINACPHSPLNFTEPQP